MQQNSDIPTPNPAKSCATDITFLWNKSKASREVNVKSLRKIINLRAADLRINVSKKLKFINLIETGIRKYGYEGDFHLFRRNWILSKSLKHTWYSELHLARWLRRTVKVFSNASEDCRTNRRMLTNWNFRPWVAYDSLKKKVCIMLAFYKSRIA